MNTESDRIAKLTKQFGHHLLDPLLEKKWHENVAIFAEQYIGGGGETLKTKAQHVYEVAQSDTPYLIISTKITLKNWRDGPAFIAVPLVPDALEARTEAERTAMLREVRFRQEHFIKLVNTKIAEFTAQHAQEAEGHDVLANYRDLRWRQRVSHAELGTPLNEDTGAALNGAAAKPPRKPRPGVTAAR